MASENYGPQYQQGKRTHVLVTYGVPQLRWLLLVASGTVGELQQDQPLA